MPELRCLPMVKKLLRAGISYKGDSLINYLVSQDSAPSWDIALVRNPELREKHWQAMVALQEELVPNYISVEDLYRNLWNLFKEVLLNKSFYQIRPNLDDKINDFCKEVKKPLRTFTIIYEIENFHIEGKHFNVGDVEVFQLTSDYLQRFVFNEDASSMQTSMVNEWADKSVAKVEVNASEIDRAYESGIIKVNSVLNVIRLAAARERISRLDDEMFLWKLGKSITIPKVKPQERTLLSETYHRHFHPLIVDMGSSIEEALKTEGSWQYILDGKLPEDTNRRIIRAIGWISHGVTANSLDYKLVDLCTALEILLLPNHKEGTKGELIALRQVLLGRGVSYVPTAILYLYEKRSNIIHSGALEITSYSDYWNLLICCLEVIRNIVHLSQQYPLIPTLEGLMGVVENEETLLDFIKHCEEGAFEGPKIKDIQKTAKERLRKCQ